MIPDEARDPSPSMAAHRLALRQIGVPDVAFPLVVRVADRLRVQTSRQNVEFAILIDLDAAVQTGNEIRGTRTGLNVGPHVALLQIDRRYLHVHTHPSDGGFSLEDAAFLVAHRSLTAIMVVGARGTWYLLSRDLDHAALDFRGIADSFWAEWDARRADYERLIREEGVTERIARRGRIHLVWQAIAAPHGLHYTRLEPLRE